MTAPVSITALTSFSPLGDNPASVWKAYNDDASCIRPIPHGEGTIAAASLSPALHKKVQMLRDSDTKYRQLDNSVLYAVLSSRAAVAAAGWTDGAFGINIGSSRGATTLFEQHHAEFLALGKAAVQASPSTTLGNISSWVAHDLGSSGPDISHSVTCSTALHALLNGVAWLRAGMADKFLAGGSEAPLTPFTLAQMKAMKIYATGSMDGYPCRAFDLNKTQNTMVLGEGAAAACLEIGIKDNALALITGIGYATELLQHSISLSATGDCLQRSMKMALQGIAISEIDAIVLHAPGTIKGDNAEYAAIQAVFGENLPLLTTNKWKIGHTLGASGLLSLELAVLMLQHNRFIGLPYLPRSVTQGKQIRNVLVNAVGFGGNAVSVVISKK